MVAGVTANNSIAVILPGVIVAVAAAVVFVTDLFVTRKAALAWIAVTGLVAAAAAALGQWVRFSGGLVFNGRAPESGFAGMALLAHGRGRT